MVKAFFQNVSDPEGPVCLPDGSWVITEMGSGWVSQISADGTTRREIAHTGRPSGAKLGADGNIWVAESLNRTLLMTTLNGVVTVISKGSDDQPFLWPNDLCFGPDGAIYMTDSGIVVAQMDGAESPEAVYELPVDGRVWRVDPATGAATLLDQGLRFTNGIAFGPGGTNLYVSETLTGNIYRYRIVNGRVSGERQLFANVMIVPPIEHGLVAGPDGMAFDADGSLYVAVLVQGDITVLGPDGSVKERLPLDDSLPTNVAFGRPGEGKLLVTESSKSQLLMLDVQVDGLTLYA